MENSRQSWVFIFQAAAEQELTKQNKKICFSEICI